MDNREPRLAGPALMAGARPVPFYTRGEEVANIASHGLGVLFSLAAALALVLRALARGDAIALLGFGIFGAALVELFSASTLYHAARDPARRRRLRVADHASIDPDHRSVGYRRPRKGQTRCSAHAGILK